MRFFTPVLCLCLAFHLNLSAEGTRELAPNGSITIGGSTTTDIAALHINHPAYNNFASYTNNDPHSRLYIHVKDPSSECIFLGFSFGHLNVTSPDPTRINYEYRIKDPAGNIVFGPVMMPTNGANIQNWSEAFTGPSQINGVNGYDAHEVTSTDLTSQGWSGAGDYYVEFQTVGDGDLLIDFWDITVADCSAPSPLAKKGRIWSYNWSIFAINDFNFPNRPFNGAFYVCAPDPSDSTRAFITKIDFNGSGFRPAAFNVAFNSFGSMNTGNISEDRKSVELLNSTQSEYEIFLNDPVELCETAVVGEITLLGISRCDDGEYCIKFITTKEGQVELLLDFDGPDDVYTPGTRDIIVTYAVESDEVGVPTCITWDGLDGLGNPLPEVAGTEIPVIISYAQGIYHFPIYDAELMLTGFQLEAIRPAASIPLLYYDDSNISVTSGSGEPAIQLSGCTVPCHRWTRFVDNSVPGFGNLHTINSWWFSQRIDRQDILFLPGYYTCEIDGPDRICHGDSTQIVLHPQLHPASVDTPEIISATWTGPGIVGTHTGNIVTINAEGSYHVEVFWLTGTGDTCSTSCDYQLTIDPPVAFTIDTLIVQGQVLDINGELYTEAGQYIQLHTAASGCDSTLTINVKVLQTALHYDLNACLSFLENGSNMDYSEFTATQPEPLSCAVISATILHRDPPQMQKHSCTPGVNNSVAMCISSLDSCDYDPGNDASLVFEVTITPDPDTAVHVTGFTFFEQAPTDYNWINGESGPNNFPTLYGLRILKNGTEIYRREDIATTNSWTLQDYDFLDEDEFIIEEPAVFRFELLPYCLVGNGAAVAAWDIDEVSVIASCAPFEGLDQIISGVISTPGGRTVKDVEVTLEETLHETLHRITYTDVKGRYGFEQVVEGSSCRISGYKNTGFLEGVSTLDLIHIQKHLLGIEEFDSPYKYIAADANRSATVSSIDLLELRKLILGKYQELPKNTSWRFGLLEESPSEWNFNEQLYIEQLLHDYIGADLTAIKIGDVNGNINFNLQGELESRSSNTFHLQIAQEQLYKNVPTRIEVRASQACPLHGLQLAFEWTDGSIIDIESGVLDISAEDFAYTDGVMRISWFDAEPILVKKDDVLFSIVIMPAQSDAHSGLLTLIDEVLRSEAYVGDDTEVWNVEIQNNEIIDAAESRNILYQNTPNPFSGSTKIEFELDKEGVASILVSDLSGKVIKEIRKAFHQGWNSIELTADDFGNSRGILICRLQSEGYAQTIKLLRI